MQDTTTCRGYPLSSRKDHITFVSADFAITAKPITVTADATNKVYGAADPAFTWRLTSGALVGGDSITGALTRVAGESVGAYAILQGSLSAGTNYTLDFVSAKLTIQERTYPGTVFSFQ